MSTIPEDSERRTIAELQQCLEYEMAGRARVDARLEVVCHALVQARWTLDAAVRAGTETMPTAEVALILRRLWDVATLGRRCRGWRCRGRDACHGD